MSKREKEIEASRFNEKENIYKETYLAVQPNYEGAGYPNPSTNKKINLSNFEYKILDKHSEYSDQHLGAVHPFLCKKIHGVEP